MNRVLEFLVTELNTYLCARTGSLSDKKVNLTSFVNDAGKYMIDDNSEGISTVNIEEDRVVKDQLKDYSLRNGRMSFLSHH